MLLTNEGNIDFSSGNITLAAASGAKLYQMEPCSFAEADRRMEKLSQLLAKEGKKSYIIPRGGSNHASIWVANILIVSLHVINIQGYVECWNEMMKQDYFGEVTDVVVVSGSGGTGLDIALANLWSGTGKRIHGVRIWRTVHKRTIIMIMNVFNY